ncbi:hypothetical protein K402DRAFT_308426, partial [Aulographum hederae CBS 113979]
MFTTFSASGANGPSSASEQSPSTPAPAQAQAPRKRAQVARACDWCRVNRIKCDDNVPCKNCENRGGRCSNSKLRDSQGAQATNRELERLRLRVQELEEQAKERGEKRPADTPSLDTTPNIHLSEEIPNARIVWEGTRTSDPQTNETIYHAPISSLDFTARVSRMLGKALNRDVPESELRPSAASSKLLQTVDSADSHNLPQVQEEFFITLFWQWYHCVYPIMNERAFREHYASLLEGIPPDGSKPRMPSALVDIVVALCMQYGQSFLLDAGNKTGKTEVDASDPSIAGYAFYRRCQNRLAFEVEAPTISTIQCQIFSAIYLWNASLFNTAHIAMSTAVRTAHMLALHHEPSQTLPKQDQGLHRRIWWTVYLLDSQMSFVTGRPSFATTQHVSCRMLSDDEKADAAFALNPAYGINWLSFHVELVKLSVVARSGHAALYAKCSELTAANGGRDIYSDADSLESLATYIKDSLERSMNWRRSLPNGLLTKRKGNASPYTPNRDALDIDLCLPVWLQRQRILLELQHHFVAMCIYRTFIRFPPRSTSGTAMADGNAIISLNYAMAITSMLDQVLKESDMLNGWYQAFHIQWDACLVMLGFILANPICPPVPTARAFVMTAIETLEKFGNSFASAASAAGIAR